MSEQERKILALMKKVLPMMPEFEKGRMLGVVETMSALNSLAPAQAGHKMADRAAARPGA